MSDPDRQTREAHAAHLDDGSELNRLRVRIDALERRLVNVEAVLDGKASAAAPQQQRPEEAVEPVRAFDALTGRAYATVFAPASVEAPAPPPPPPPPLPPPPIPPPVPRGQASAWQPAPISPPRASADVRVPSELISTGARPAQPTRSLEDVIGQNWASWVGAIVLLLGIVFFLKYAWDQGWIRPSPAARVAAAVGAGMMLCGVGEWLHFRRMRALAGALWGAGVGVVLASFFGAHAYFDPPVIGANAAFIAVAITAAASIVAAMHINVSVVAMIGLIGAYLAPNLLTGPDDRSTFFMLYLALLAGVALIVAQLKRPWVLLRWLALAATYAWLGLWWSGPGREHGHGSLMMLATLGFAAAFVIDAAVALVRLSRRSSEHARADTRTFIELFDLRLETGPLDVQAVLVALLSTVCSMLLFSAAWDRLPAVQANVGAILLAALLAIPGALLAHLRPTWVALRWALVAGGYLWLATWWWDFGRGSGDEMLAVTWALALYALLLGENLLTLRRNRAALAATFPAVDAQVAAASLVSTGASIGLLVWVWGGTNPALVGGIAIVLALVQGAAGFGSRSRDYFVSSLLQSAALLTLAAPLVLDRFAITLAWIIMGVLLAIAAWQLNLPKARGWAAGLLLLALARLIVYDWRDPSLTGVEFHVFDQPVTRWLMIGWTIALLYHLLAWLRPGQGKWPALEAWIAQHVPPPVEAQVVARPQPARAGVLEYASSKPDPLPLWAALAKADHAGVGFAAFGTILFIAFTVGRWGGPPATLALIGWLGGLLLLARAGARIGYGAQTWVLGILVSARWLIFDNLIPLTDTWRSGGGGVPGVLNLPALCGALLAAAIVLGIRVAPSISLGDATAEGRPDREQPRRILLIVWAVAIGFALLNFETIRYVDSIAGLREPAIVKQVAMSVLWAITGFGAILFGFQRHLAPVRWAALVLLAVTLAKILVIDMAEVQAIWRILSFVAVGLLLLGVSFVYHRQVQVKAAHET